MGDVSSEPTMEEILSSIKRVIEESEGAPTAAAARARRAIRPAEPEDEVLELRDPAPFPPAPASADPAPVSSTPLPRAEPVSEPPAAPRPAPAASTAPADPLLSATAAAATRGPLEALSRMVVKPESPGADTLEGLVRDMLRPMLRDWLDANLPPIVEAMVAREIARISGR